MTGRPSVYLDECVDLALVAGLRERGFTATAARYDGPLGAEDDEQISYAAEHGWMILSHNALHFQRWHRTFVSENRPHGGIVLLPDTGPVARLTIRAALMLDWIAGLEYRSRLFKWGDLQKQLTQGLRLPGYSEDEVRLALGQPPAG